MKTAEYFKRKLFLLGMILLTLTANAQDYVTKSGNTIFPADRLPAIFPQSSKQPSSSDSLAGTFLVVTRPDLLAPLQPFIRWKRQQGYRVETYVSQTHLCDSIRTHLKERYLNASTAFPAQEYVLLVGDVNRIQAFTGKYTPSALGSSVTDMYYGEYTGDYIPEAYVGRLSVADSSELAHVVGKIVRYEQGDWASSANRMVLIAGRENRTPAPETTNGQVNYLSQLAAQHRPYLDTICFRNPASDTLTDSILATLQMSNALVNYTAHCTRNGWSNPDINYHGIDTLGNPVPTLFINNCCLSNAFDGTCYGEQLLRRNEGGAIGAIGATNETLWAEDYYWAVGAKYPASLTPSYDSSLPGAFDSLLIPLYNDYTLGAMLYAGCKAVSQSGSPFDAFYWETYCLLGDPSMTPFLGQSERLWLTPQSPVQAGITSLQVSCPPHTRICATQDTLLLASAVSLSDSSATLFLHRGLNGDSITLTASRPGAIAQIMTLPIPTRDEGFLAATDYHVEDSLLHVVIKNVGRSPVNQHTIALSQTPSDSLVGATFSTPQPITIHSLSPLSDTSVTFQLHNYTIGIEPLIKAYLTAYDSMLSPYSTLHIYALTPNIRPRILRIRLSDSSGNIVQSIVPNQHFFINADLSHPADSALLLFDVNSSTQSASLHYSFPSYWNGGNDHIHLTLSAHKGRWLDSREGWLVPYSTYERFESGAFDNLPWLNRGPFPWTIDSLFTHQGLFSARSATINHSQKSVLELVVETLADDSITFFFNVSSEAHDWLYFFIDGRRCGYWSGNTGWRYYARPLAAGRHLLQWVYQKDAALSERNDCAHIDDIRIPLALWSQPYGTSENPTPLGIESLSKESPFQIYPNPTSHLLNIELPESAQSRLIQLFEINGRKVDEILIPPHVNSTQYFTTSLRLGVYLLVLHDDVGNRHIHKLIVTK